MYTTLFYLKNQNDEYYLAIETNRFTTDAANFNTTGGSLFFLV